MERERVQLASIKDKQEYTATEINQARTRWSLVTEALLSLIALAPELDEATRVRILEPLRNAEEKLARRRRAKTSEDEETDTAQDTPDSGDSDEESPAPSAETESI